MKHVHNFHSSLNLPEAESLLKKSSLLLVGFLLAILCVTALGVSGIGFFSGIEDFYAAHIPAIERMLQYIDKQYNEYAEETILERMQLVKTTYSMQWFVFTVFVVVWFPWMILQLSKISRLYAHPSHPAYQVLKDKMIPWRMMVGAILTMAFVYLCLFFEVYQGNYDFTFYSRIRNNAHVNDLDLFRYAFFMFGGLLFLSVMMHVLNISYISVRNNHGGRNEL